MIRGLLPPLPSRPKPPAEREAHHRPCHAASFETITAWAVAFAQEMDGFAAYHPGLPHAWYMLHSADGRARLRLHPAGPDAVEATVLATNTSQLVTSFGELRALLAEAAADYTGLRIRRGGVPSPTATSLLSLRHEGREQAEGVQRKKKAVPLLERASSSSMAALWRRFSTTSATCLTPVPARRKTPRRALSLSLMSP